MWIYVKDKFNISNKAWHELATQTKQMPNNYKIEKKLKELNAKWNLLLRNKIPYYMKFSRHVNFATPYFRDFAKILHFDSL